MSIQVDAIFPDSIEFSFEQTNFSLFDSLGLTNNVPESCADLVLEISCEPVCFEPKRFSIPALASQTTFSIKDIAVELKSDFFLKLPERVDGKIRVELTKGGELLADCSATAILIPPPPRISIIYDRFINYAFQQNSIPVVKELKLQNNGRLRKDLILRVTAEPAFAPPNEIRLQAIDPAGEFQVSPLDLKLSHDFLAELNEKVSGWLKVEMLEGGEVVQSITEPVSLLARNEWCGLVALPEILAAFVLPNDPSVMTILGRASDILKEVTGRSGLNGYQDKNRKRAWEQAAAIYKAIGELGIRYINPLASFESTGQKVRFPSEIINQRFGTCLDIALLFAACYEQAGLRPFVFMHDGHAYAGCWLEERSLPEPSGDDLQQVRKFADDELLIVFETTTITTENPGALNDAELLAKPHLKTEKPFRLALDVHASRSARISPLPVPGQERVPSSSAATTLLNPSSGLGSREFADEIVISDESATKPNTRIDMWKSRLLDLSLRNRLLNFRETKATIRILSEPEHVEDELAAERELSIRPKPKLMSDEDPRNADTYTKEQRADALKEHLRDELRIGRLHTHLEEAEHVQRLTELFRAARNALDENGTNTLFATVGILEWRETKHSDRVHRAPLLLVPVELKRKSVLEGFTLRRIDEETRLNVTLMEMLRQNFRKEISGLDPLPEDENGVNIERVLRIFRDAVRDLEGWEVKSEIWLGQFSFTKFLLWKDLADRLNDLTKNRVVNHLINEAGTPIPNPYEDIRAQDLDDRFHPREVLCPRSADSSQLAAVMAAADGHDFVLEGPPGTGKSQTITNIIAHCLGVGKRVLFVAEKRAALDVVHRRLREDGLEPFCLELHSNKTGKADVLAQFDRSLKFAEETDTKDWEYRVAEIERLRTALNTYTRALHKRLPCGLSAHNCFDYLLARNDQPVVKLDEWDSILETKPETLEKAREVARLIKERTRFLLPLEEHALAPLECTEWSPAWAERALGLNRELVDQTQRAIVANQGLLTWMKMDRPMSRKSLQQLDDLLATLLSPEPVGLSFATTPWLQLSQDLQSWISLTRERRELRSSMARYHVAQSAESIALPCEAGTQEAAEAMYLKGRELQTFTHCAKGAVGPMLSWLKAPTAQVSRKMLINLAGLAECLMDTDEVGAAFATTPWSQLSQDLESWISLTRERRELRSSMARYHVAQSAESIALPCEAGTQEAAEAMYLKGRELQTITRCAQGAAGPMLSWLKAPSAQVSRKMLISLAGLAECLMDTDEVGAAFATTPWQECALHFDDWIALVKERNELRSKLSAYDEAKLLALDLNFLKQNWEKAQSTWFLPKMLNTRSVKSQLKKALLEKTKTNNGTMGEIVVAAIRMREINLKLTSIYAQAEALLGKSWRGGEPDSAQLEKIRLWGENLHNQLGKLAEGEASWLLAMRNLLSECFKAGPGIFAKGAPDGERLVALRDAVTTFEAAAIGFMEEANIDRASLDAAQDHPTAVSAMLDIFLHAALRIRKINSDFTSIYVRAEALLGKSWRGGEPDSAQLEKIRLWGENLHDQLGKLAEGNESWLSTIGNLLSECFKAGPGIFAKGTPDGDYLIALRDAVATFEDSSLAFMEEAKIDRTALDGADDYLTAVSVMLDILLQAAPRIREINRTLASEAATAQECLGVLWAKGEPNPDTLEQALHWGEFLHSRLLAFADEDLGWLGSFRQQLSELFTEGPSAYGPETNTVIRMARFREQWAGFNQTLERYLQELRLRRGLIDESSDHFSATLTLAERIAGSWEKIREWCSWQKVRHQALGFGMSPVVELLESSHGTTIEVPALFERSFRRKLLFTIMEQEDSLREFFGNEHNERIARFRELDEQLAKLSRDIIRIRLAAGIPREEVRNDIPRQEIGLLRKEIGKKARHIPVRQLIGRIPTLLPRLKPCVLMSPLSVAQYLEASHETFDVVIFDEASQIPVWDAIGAIARGRQLIVVGDPKQLPPSNFFATNAADEDDLTPEEHKDLESILDELMTHGLRHKRLNWHYRSRHEGLITFSNRQYYENELLTFPSPEMEHGGVRFRYLPEARYDKGRSRTNRVEAAALVKELVSRLRNTNLPRRSYGVVTFSQAQQALVENLLDEERHKHPEIEHHFGENPPLEGEPVFVKNLENVQGDERDVILFSVCYGLDEAGKLSMNFGPLNRDGGERRLNVAATRAKHEVLVFSGLRGDQIDLTRTRARGVRDLKHFLQYADRGHEALIAATSNSHDAEADSEFERMVATRIRAAGYDVHHQVGCSGYRIDLAVVDPAAPGRYLLGVECDGATYHRAATARDRDKLRQAVLEDLGWTLHRIWSTDWWHNANSEMEKLLTAITSAIEARQLETADSVDQLVEEVTIQTPENSEASAPTAAPYTLTDFSSFSDRISADRFYSKEYDINLREMIGHVLETEGPISDTLLVNWIARAHALQRSGRIITERVLNLAKRHFHISQDPVGGTFIWRDKEAQATWSTYRTAGAEESMRNMEEISFEEIRAAILKNSSGDVPFEVARAFGIRRLASEGRSRIEAVMQNCSIENKKRRNS